MSVPIIAALLGANASAADAPVDAHGFVLAAYDADARDPLTVQRPGSFDGGSGFVGAIFEYARRPLSARDPDSDEEVDLIADLYALNISFGFAVHKRLRFDFTAPGYAFTGFDLTREETTGFGVGDTRASTMIVLARSEEGNGASFALVPHLDIPSGQFHAYLGRRNFAGGGVATVTYEDGPFTGTLASGVQIETATEISNLQNPDSVIVGAALGWKLDDTLGVIAEASGRIPIGGTAPGTTALPTEFLGHLRFAEADGGAHFTAGAAAGITEGVGSSRFRVFVGGGFGAKGGPRDRDGDGLVGDLDACPDEAETQNGYLDDDGCPDARPNLTATASVEGTTVSGAMLKIDGPVQRRVTTTAKPFELEVDPGSVWKGSAALGDCLEGEAVATVGELDAALDVPMGIKVHGQIRLLLLDTNGDPVPDARVRFVHKDRYCVPPGQHQTNAEGLLILGLGKGTHQVIVDALGRQISEEFRPEEGREVELLILVNN